MKIWGCFGLFQSSIYKLWEAAKHSLTKLYQPKTIEKPAETQTSIRIASQLVRKTTVTPIPEDSGSNPLHGHEPGILMTKKAYEVVFYIGDPDMIM
jgi:hypothetical protein